VHNINIDDWLTMARKSRKLFKN